MCIETPPDGSSRRTALKTALTVGGGLAVAGLLPAAGAMAAPARPDAAEAGDRIVMLGVDGGPKINTGRAKPAIALVVNGAVYLVDCGLDTADQLVASGLGFAALRHVFVTHHHLDHTSGLPGLLLHGWTDPQGLRSVQLWGPPQMSRTTAGLRVGFGEEIEIFGAGGFPPFPAVRAHDVEIGRGRAVQRVMEDENVIVDATRVFHGPEVKNPYAYRFTVKRTGKVVVFSGDTHAPNENLIELAHGCDVLVHEVQDNELIDVVVAKAPPAQRDALREHLLVAHSDVTDVPSVAQAAGARRLVFCHYTPLPEPPGVFLAKARKAAEVIGYRGTIIAPEQLDTIPL